MVSFCAERNNGNIRFVIARTGKLRYYISKFVSCFLCGGLAVLIGISLYMCAMYMLFPPLSSYNANEQILETYRGSGELWENIKYCISKLSAARILFKLLLQESVHHNLYSLHAYLCVADYYDQAYKQGI